MASCSHSWWQESPACEASRAFQGSALLTAQENKQAGEPVPNLSTVTVDQRQSQKREFQMCENDSSSTQIGFLSLESPPHSTPTSPLNHNFQPEWSPGWVTPTTSPARGKGRTVLLPKFMEREPHRQLPLATQQCALSAPPDTPWQCIPRRYKKYLLTGEMGQPWPFLTDFPSFVIQISAAPRRSESPNFLYGAIPWGLSPFSGDKIFF